jgi:hypothetical protein
VWEGQQAMERTIYGMRPVKRARLTLLEDGDRGDVIDEVSWRDFFCRFFMFFLLSRCMWVISDFHDLREK